VEHKGLTLTVHYRGTPEQRATEVDATVTETTSPFIESGELRLTRGKMVVEVRPAIAWDKGKAIEKIREECGDLPFPVYFGDDRTDEDGFRAAQDMGGLAVFVGEPRQGTEALHQLDSPREVAETLRLLLEET
jgi:trehalose 6-phosphate phosphatase